MRCSIPPRTALASIFIYALAVNVDGQSLAEESIPTSSQLQISATATYSPSVTGVDQASSVFATATTAPELGNPTDLDSYPECAITCANGRSYLISEPNDLSQLCGVEFRTRTAFCEAAICSNVDLQKTQLLAQQLCRPFYANNAALGSSVIASLATSTPVALAAKRKNATDISSYPQCAQNCVRSSNVGGCGSLTNTACICGNATAAAQLTNCANATCSVDDRLEERALEYVLCASTGGLSPSTVSSNSTNASTSSPSPSPFTGQGNSVLSWQGSSWVGSILALVILVTLL